MISKNKEKNERDNREEREIIQKIETEYLKLRKGVRLSEWRCKIRITNA